jgi:hypothetical protein
VRVRQVGRGRLLEEDKGPRRRAKVGLALGEARRSSRLPSQRATQLSIRRSPPESRKQLRIIKTGSMKSEREGR